MTAPADPREQIRAFVARHLGGLTFTDDQDLFASGHVNSLFAVQLVMFVEGTLGVPVAGDDLDIANFASVDKIAAFARDRSAAPTG